MSAPTIEIAIVGDVHGDFDRSADEPLLSRHDVRLCTGDLTPNSGKDRFVQALGLARQLREAATWTVLGNHDGPPGFTGRRMPDSYLKIVEALGDRHLSGRRVELPELDLALVGGRPLSAGGTELRYPVPGREDWSLSRWADEVAELIEGATASRVVVLSHGGPSGLGDRRDSIYGCDFRVEQGDWGDPDLRAALDRAVSRDRAPVAIVAGHMHHDLFGGGHRQRAVRERGMLVFNAAVVPRVKGGRRALGVLRLEGRHATARIDWHGPDGTIESEELDV